MTAGYREAGQQQPQGATARVQKDKSTIQVSLTFSPILDANGRIVGASSIARGISERKRAEEQAHPTSQDARSLIEASLGFTGTLLMRLSGPLTADQEKQLNTILTSGKPLLPLIHDPLDVAKIESGTMGPSMETVMCRAVIDEIFSTPSHLAKAEGLKFETEARADEISVRSDRRACTDSAKLRQ